MHFRKSIFLLSVIGCMFLCSPAFAEQWGDYEYEYIDRVDPRCRITRYIGSGGAVVIPYSINGAVVQIIDDGAFRDCTSLTSISIPGWVYMPPTIRNQVFYGCTNLKTVKIENARISGSQVFYGCTSLTSVNIGINVPIIGNQAFYGCTSLTSVNIGPNVSSIGDQAFYDCTSLTGAWFLGNAPTMGLNVFDFSSPEFFIYYSAESTGFTNPWYGYPSIKAEFGDFRYWITDSGGCFITKYIGAGGVVEIPASLMGIPVVGIGDSAFRDCTGLTSVTIPNSVTSIGSSAFSSCTGLTSVSIPDSVTTIGGTTIGTTAFYNCRSLTNINVDMNNPAFSSQDGALYNKTKTTIIQYPTGRSGGYIIPNSVTSIGVAAFVYCSGLTSVNIPSSVTNIGFIAFAGCTSLTAAYFYGNAPTMGGQVFAQQGMDEIITVYYTVEATGFTNPWYGYPTAVFADVDRDSVPDAIDNCPSKYNPQQLDADGDGIGDVCETGYAGCGGNAGCGQPACELYVDSDGDGIPDVIDNCPNLCNFQQGDADGDGIGDVCETGYAGCGGNAGCGLPACEAVCTP
jgi:hypothetical protein